MYMLHIRNVGLTLLAYDRATMVTFDEAYEAAAARYGEEAWWNLHPTVVMLAILDAMRRLDAETRAMRPNRQRAEVRE
jgi:hypothetical protein